MATRKLGTASWLQRGIAAGGHVSDYLGAGGRRSEGLMPQPLFIVAKLTSSTCWLRRGLIGLSEQPCWWGGFTT